MADDNDLDNYLMEKLTAEKDALLAGFAAKPPANYDELVARIVTLLSEPKTDKEWDWLRPDPTRITLVDHREGNYKGTRLYIIGAEGMQPERYWSLAVDYGDYAGDRADLDTLLDLDPKTPAAYWELASSVVRALKPLDLWQRVDAR